MWQARQFPAAIARFEAALKLTPGNANTWNGLGWANFNFGRVGEAEAAFRKAVALEPDHSAARNGLGQIYLSQRKYDEAEAELLHASSQAPAAWYGLARLYLLQGRFAEAEKYARKVVDTGQADAAATKMLEAARARSLGDRLQAMIEPPLAPATNVVPSRPANDAGKPLADADAVNQQPELRALVLAGSGQACCPRRMAAFRRTVASPDRVSCPDWREHSGHSGCGGKTRAIFACGFRIGCSTRKAWRRSPCSTRMERIPSRRLTAARPSGAPGCAGIRWHGLDHGDPLRAGKKGQTPAAATVRLCYSEGPWTGKKEVDASFRGSMSLGTGVLLGAPGQDAEGHAFVQIVRDHAEAGG